MSTTTAVAPIGPAQCSEFVSHKMLDTRASVSAPAENAYLIYEIAFFQEMIFFKKDCKYTLSGGSGHEDGHE